ncbi:MAG TPA: hypothetical protein VLM76_00750 [Patescibacteria group bacterium]|nr:hypothetical protein [Patescibacteria group bacterium]
MKFEVLDSFRADYGRLSQADRKRLKKILPAFVAACERFGTDPSMSWPSALRVKNVEGAPGIFEMTWSFSGPDGRATFEWTRIAGAPGVRWRRIGGHRILRTP